jgi:hypothetical protein
MYWKESKGWVENIKAVLVTSKEAGLEVHAENANCMLMYREQNVGTVLQYKEANKPFENSAKFKYFGTTLTN